MIKVGALQLGSKDLRSIFMFLMMGGLTTVVHVTVGLIAHYQGGLTAFNANIVAFFAGFTVSYFGHRRYSFRSRGPIGRSMPRFFVIQATSFVINQVVIYVAVNVWGYPYPLALIAMICVVMPTTYILGRLWAFSDGDF